MERIQLYARILKYLCIILGIPIILFSYIVPWLSDGGRIYGFSSPEYVMRALTAPFYVKYPVMAIDAVSYVLLLLLVYFFIQLFDRYSDGIFFSSQTFMLYRNITRVLLVLTIYNLVKYTLLTLLTTLPNPPGQRILAIQFSSDDLWHIMIVGFLAIITSLMQQAYTMKQEHDLVI